MRFGYSIWSPGLKLTNTEALLDEAETLGADTVELPFFALHAIIDGQLVEPVCRQLEAMLEGRSLDLTAHGMLSINLMDAPDAAAEHERICRANIDLASRLGAERLVIHTGMTASDDPGVIADAYARQREALSRLGDHAQDQGVMLCVENIWSHDGRQTALPTQLAQELTAVGHEAVCGALDLAHAWLQCDVVGADFVEQIGPLAAVSPHIHVCDCFGRSRWPTTVTGAEAAAYGGGDLHLPIGWGAIPWDQLAPGFLPAENGVLNLELDPAYWWTLSDNLKRMRAMAPPASARH